MTGGGKPEKYGVRSSMIPDHGQEVSLPISLRMKVSNQDFKAIKDRMVRRHIGFLYALKAKLRDAVDENYQQYLDEADLQEINLHSNVHNAILTLQSRDLQQLSKDGMIDGFRFMELNQATG